MLSVSRTRATGARIGALTRRPLELPLLPRLRALLVLLVPQHS